jgi:CubicO group peptidase (beta-lactamase class C family)
MPLFVAYHGLDAPSHQSRVNELAPQGYRPVSLSVSGDPSDARYAAVWVQRPGPGWRAVHGLSAAEYQATFDALVAQGYAPVLVSATGPADLATFAALFEQGVAGPWFARHGLRWDPQDDPNTITHENVRAFRDGYIPRCLAVYGTPSDRRFAGVWIKNDAPTAWSWWLADKATHQSIFEAETQGALRPGWVAVAPDGWYLSVFRDDRIGEWWARHGITGVEYQAEFDARVSAGLMPIVVQAGGTGDHTRFASIFARTEVARPRIWTVTGLSDRRLASLDEIVRQFMAAHAIRAGALAVLRGQDLFVSRGYTWAEESYPTTQPDSLFRIASLSKAFTAAAIDHLVSTKRLTLATRAYPFLGVTTALLASQHPDPAVDTITVQHLIDHFSGLKHARVTENGVERTFEPTDDLRTIAALLGRTVTPSREDLVRYMYGERLDFPPGFPPGRKFDYSNFGYTLLTSVIEAAAQRPYLDFLRYEVLASEGLTDIWVGATAASGQLPREVRYDHPGVGLSVLQPAAIVRLPAAYGTFALENNPGSGGLVSTAPTVARFISRHAVWGLGGRSVATRHGAFDGTTSGARSRPDGLDFAYVFNRRVTGDEHDGITNAIDAYLNAHPV